jgi:two-component system OmpR family response regulator
MASAPNPSNQIAGRIVLVEDDAEISSLLMETLSANGFAVKALDSGTELSRLVKHGSVDLLILDVMLPGQDGFSICRQLRAVSTIPIIMLTALGAPVDRVVGLEIGADDYVAKPFDSRELVARIRALLRRSRVTGTAEHVRMRPYSFAGWRMHPVERELYNSSGVRITTTSTEFDLLIAFCRNPGRVLSREQLLELTHSGAAGPIERSIDVHISRIRQKIEPDPRDPTLLKTVRLGGYIFTPTVELL